MIFSYSTWLARYPEFSAITEETAGLYFAEATLYCDNTAASPVPEPQRAVLLNMLVAHIASINASSVVGRVSSASEGSVSVSIEGPPPGSAMWYQQSKYGASYWQATAQYRKARIYPGANRSPDPWSRYKR